MFGRRTPEQLAAADNVRRAKRRGKDAADLARRLKAETDAAAKRR